MKALSAGTFLMVGLAISGLGLHVFWLRYFELGGIHGPQELAAYLRGDAEWSWAQHDVAAQVLNECCTAMGLGYPVAYAHEL
jgi:hypothetical protein